MKISLNNSLIWLMGDSPVCVPHIDAQYNVKKCK